MPQESLTDGDLSMFPEKGESEYKSWQRRIELLYGEYKNDPLAMGRLKMRVIARLPVEIQEDLYDENLQTWD